MDPFTFAKQVSSQQEREPELDSWAHHYLESSAVQTLHAARYVENAPSKIFHDYKTVLRTTLERLPGAISKYLRTCSKLLMRIAGADAPALKVESAYSSWMSLGFRTTTVRIIRSGTW